jgi:microcompartment protein CcmK/EutM
MKLARVIGSVWATTKHESLHARKILLVRPISPSGDAAGEAYLAVDTVDAGVSDVVLVLDEGGCAGMVLDRKDPPIRTVIVGVVDEAKVELA